MEHTAALVASWPKAAADPTCEALGKDPRFHLLLSSRRRFVWGLTVLMLGVYFGYILTLAYRPDLLGARLVESQPMTVGIPIGFGMFAFTFGLVAIYVHRANAVYDAMIHDLRQGDGQ
ncbi:DUF485 domain-containing protein [Azohydromonas lata]|uniref:DUF485 domain-containing protein n=1 Tax=Azohydromonas lata TaxID=45677 RepID=UPI000836949E|nr:DUF485 domain-containing protein [Azohydromonas lata]